MKYFITPEPQRMDPCEFWEYLQQFLPCEPTPTIQEPVPTPTEPITYEPPVLTQPTPIVGFEPVEQSIDKVYYYHSDHLGSSTYVTDDNGRPVTYYDYLPFGEVAVEHNQTTNFNNGYKFNGKELDEATGMSYYGARYYDSRLSVFVSVDPLVEQTFEPYSYVGNNPVMFTDSTGMSKEEVETDYFDGYGNFVKRINDGSNAIVITNSTGISYFPSKMKVSQAANNAIINIAKHYRKEMGISDKYLFGATASSDGKTSSLTPAFVRKSNNVTYFNNSGGYSQSLDNVNSFKSIIRHENRHQIDNEKSLESNVVTHAKVYLYQMKHNEFSESPFEFQQNVVGSFMNYLYNIEKKGYGMIEVQDLVSQFNNLDNGFKIKIGGLGSSGNKSVTDYKLYYNGNELGIVKYSINNEN